MFSICPNSSWSDGGVLVENSHTHACTHTHKQTNTHIDYKGCLQESGRLMCPSNWLLRDRKTWRDPPLNPTPPGPPGRCCGWLPRSLRVDTQAQIDIVRWWWQKIDLGIHTYIYIYLNEWISDSGHMYTFRHKNYYQVFFSYTSSFRAQVSEPC